MDTSRIETSRMKEHMTLEDEGTTILQNARNRSPNDPASYPRRPESVLKVRKKNIRNYIQYFFT
jgi:hypothetical protein